MKMEEVFDVDQPKNDVESKNESFFVLHCKVKKMLTVVRSREGGDRH